MDYNIITIILLTHAISEQLRTLLRYDHGGWIHKTIRNRSVFENKILVINTILNCFASSSSCSFWLHANSMRETLEVASLLHH